MSDTENLQKASAALEAAQLKIKELQDQLNEASTPEAVYAFNTTLAHGATRGQWTIRAKHGEQGAAFIARVNTMVEHLGKAGWGDGISAGPEQPSQLASPPSPTASAEIEGTVYEAQAIMMEVGESYSGHKPQLIINCKDMEDALKITSRDMGTSDLIMKLNRVGKYLPEQLTKGKKYQVNYIIHWTWSKPDAKGKKWRNVIDIYPAN